MVGPWRVIAALPAEFSSRPRRPSYKSARRFPARGRERESGGRSPAGRQDRKLASPPPASMSEVGERYVSRFWACSRIGGKDHAAKSKALCPGRISPEASGSRCAGPFLKAAVAGAGTRHGRDAIHPGSGQRGAALEKRMGRSSTSMRRTLAIGAAGDGDERRGRCQWTRTCFCGETRGGWCSGSAAVFEGAIRAAHRPAFQ